MNGHDILELKNVLVQIQFSQNKTKRDIYNHELGIPVALQVAEQLIISLLTQLKNLSSKISSCLSTL